MAREYKQTVVLVDCDFRKPSIASYLGLKKVPGLAEYFFHDKPLNEIILWPGIAKLTMIAGSRQIADATEIMGSDKMGALVEELKNRYPERYTFFDLPPLLSNADPIAFMSHVDCVILVVEAGRTTAREIKKAQSLVPPDKLLGFILNKDTSTTKKYYY
jgi:non-specific protein-tyrosine kinase